MHFLVEEDLHCNLQLPRPHHNLRLGKIVLFTNYILRTLLSRVDLSDSSLSVFVDTSRDALRFALHAHNITISSSDRSSKDNTARIC